MPLGYMLTWPSFIYFKFFRIIFCVPFGELIFLGEMISYFACAGRRFSTCIWAIYKWWFYPRNRQMRHQYLDHGVFHPSVFGIASVQAKIKWVVTKRNWYGLSLLFVLTKEIRWYPYGTRFFKRWCDCSFSFCLVSIYTLCYLPYLICNVSILQLVYGPVVF